MFKFEFSNFGGDYFFKMQKTIFIISFFQPQNMEVIY